MVEKIRTNIEKLVKISVMGEITSPLFGRNPYRISSTGEPVVLPSFGGITYNVRVGDSATDWYGDHVEPGVSVRNKDKDDDANRGLNVLTCIGNEAIVMSGDAKGKKGVVTGKHGGVEHILIDFKPQVLEKLVVGDKIMIKAIGQGLKLLDYPSIRIMNLSPNLLRALTLKKYKDGIQIPVTHIIPSSIMGSGIGAYQVYTGDYDIQLFDDETREKYNLSALRLGDIIAITDADHSFGRVYRKGVITIGVIVHANSVVSGHGPGVVTIMTGRSIYPIVSENANIATLLRLRNI